MPGMPGVLRRVIVKAVLFDFGGVLAEEGFRDGLKEIGRKNGLDPDDFFRIGDELIYETGYLTGGVSEAAWWSALRDRTGIQGSDEELREEILKRFVYRPAVIAYADSLRARGLTVAMLSDQTNWLDEIDRERPLFRHFDRVFNSFRTRKSKRDASVFSDICGALDVRPGEALFIDDNESHIRRAQGAGLQTILFTSIEDFEKKAGAFLEAPGAEQTGRKQS